MFIYPSIDPVAMAIGPIKIHWYGLMYLLAFSLAYAIGVLRIKLYKLTWTKDELSDLIFYAALGIVISGRLGYMLFYQTMQIWAAPLEIFKIWQGGMSFHGGVIGVIIAASLFAKKTHKSFLSITDFIMPLVPLGLGAGRIGNFINQELWGRVTDVPWGMIFPIAGNEVRHPSQLYEFGLEGIILFVIIWTYARKKRPKGAVSAVFLMSYAICRCIAEFFREPDSNLGFVAFDFLTMGQLLSMIMLIAGIILFILVRKNP
jgi:phosphatidylglycerol:prolipoprotein diacylglycerol transferase